MPQALSAALFDRFTLHYSTPLVDSFSPMLDNKRGVIVNNGKYSHA
jgi:hypothetical protein